MNKIIREHYPASKLPEDLRAGIDPTRRVTVTVLLEQSLSAQPNTDHLRKLLDEARSQAKGGSIEDAAAHVRSLRDEWDD